MARYRPHGGLDSTFGPNGGILTNFEALWNEQARDVAIDSSGRIVAAGGGMWFDTPRVDVWRMAVARYSEYGNLDVSFSKDGKRSLYFPGQHVAIVNAVGIDASGRIVVAGEADGEVALARFTEDGQQDRSFDSDGRVVTEGVSTRVNAMVIAPDGRIVVAGGACEGSGYRFTLARYRSDGSLDPTFGVDGKVLTNFAGTSTAYARDVVIDADGRILAAGFAVLGSSW